MLNLRWLRDVCDTVASMTKLRVTKKVMRRMEAQSSEVGRSQTSMAPAADVKGK